MHLAEDPVRQQASTEKGNRAAQFGDYELLRQIGRGGMGVVYEARQLSLNRIVALKMIMGGDLASASSVRRFRIEAEAAAKLTHANIVSIYEFGEHDGLPFFSMQFIEGTSLDREMRAIALCSIAAEKNASKTRARQAQVIIANLIGTLARALHHAHQQGVVHCDVKPSNVLIDIHGQPHLTDFGIARFLDHDGHLTKSGIMGTPRYMSPEQVAGNRDEVTASSDIYSLGVILYELLTGRTPFRGATPSETLRQVAEVEPVAPQNLNPLANRDLATICIKCLQKKPRHRYASAGDLADDLGRWTHQEPIHARRISTHERLWRWCQRKPVIAGLAASVALLLLAVTIGAALVAWRLSEEEQQQARTLAVLRTELERELDELWNHPERSSVRITSEKRSVLTPGKPLRSGTAVGVEQRLAFGVYTFQAPSAMAKKFAPLLTTLEKGISEQLRRPVRIDFVIYRSYTNGHEGLLSGEVDFMRMGPASYILMKEKRPGVSLLAAQENLLQGGIFTLARRGIENLGQLKGQPFAFGDAESTFGTHMAKLALLRAGIRSADLSAHSRHFPSHDKVVEAVKSGAYAAGAANTVLLGQDFSLIHIFTNVSLRMPFVARSGIEPRVAAAIKKALLAERAVSVLTNVEAKLTGFREVSDEEYREFREEMEQAKLFGELGH